MFTGKKLEKYETYVNDVLRADLGTIRDELDRAITDLAEYEQLEKTIEIMKECRVREDTFKLLSDIGCNFFMQANVEDFSSILLNVGYGYHLSFTLDEALLFISSKKKYLDVRISALRNNSAKIKAHIKLMLLYMNQLT